MLLAVLALGGQVGVASLAADQGADGPVLCGTQHRLGTVAPAHPRRLAVVHPVGVMPSSGDAHDLLAPDPPALPGPEPSPVRLAEGRQGLRGPPAGIGVLPYPRGPPILG